MKRTLLNATAILVLAFLFSCRGSQQNKLIGNWERVYFTEPTDVKIYWQFYAGDALDVYSNNPPTAAGDTVKYTYSIDGNSFSIFKDGEYDAAAADIRGTYWVDQLNDSYFKVTKIEHPIDPSGNNWGDTVPVNPYLRIELVKR
jgi:hypothetical protein